MLLWLMNIDFAGGGIVVPAGPPKHEGFVGLNVGKMMN